MIIQKNQLRRPPEAQKAPSSDFLIDEAKFSQLSDSDLGGNMFFTLVANCKDIQTSVLLHSEPSSGTERTPPHNALLTLSHPDHFGPPTGPTGPSGSDYPKNQLRRPPEAQKAPSSDFLIEEARFSLLSGSDLGENLFFTSVANCKDIQTSDHDGSVAFRTEFWNRKNPAP